jgi:TfoX/Sxy family transcriptional regulator of competence genes
MASDQGFVDYVCEQLRGSGSVTHRKMFGEYAIYLDEKVVALVCDNQLFVKPTTAGRTLLGAPVEAPPYPGAKPHFLIEGELDDSEFMATLIRATDRELPAAKPKKGGAARKAKKPAAKKPAAKKKRT